MWTTPPTSIATWGRAAAIVTVVLGLALIAAVWARGDMFGHQCRVAGHGADSEDLQLCIAQLATGRRRLPRPAGRSSR